MRSSSFSLVKRSFSSGAGCLPAWQGAKSLHIFPASPLSYTHLDAHRAGAGHPVRLSGEQRRRGVFHLAQARLPHFKNPDFIGGAKAVLAGPKDVYKRQAQPA